MVVVVVGVGRVWTVKGHAGGEQSKKTPMPIVSASTDSLVVSVVFFWLLTQSSISSKQSHQSKSFLFLSLQGTLSACCKQAESPSDVQCFAAVMSRD